MRTILLSFIALLCALQTAQAADEILLTRGERVSGDLNGGQNQFKAGGKDVKPGDILAVRFSNDAPPVRMQSGVFLRGGSLIAGTLSSLIRDEAEVTSAAFGALKLKRDDIAGAFSPLPPGQSENMPELASYAAILSATLGNPNAKLKPGTQTRLRFAGLDEVSAEKVMRIGTEQILLSSKKGVETIGRQYARLLEIAVPALQANADDAKFGPEWIVRLKSGDLLRGRVMKIDGGGMTLKTTFFGDRTIERGLLAAMFQSGDSATWLSTLKPAKDVQTPYFDASFPTRLDANAGGGDMLLRGIPVERGVGVHSKSEIEFSIPQGSTRFVALAGIDDSTRGRGAVSARVLVDGKEVWKVASATGKDAAQWVGVDLGGAKTLRLEVDFGADDDDSGDHFNWGWAALVK
jgi:NPCBM/NEW2 domain